MPFVVLVETPENSRGRFIAASIDDAFRELSRQFSIGSTVQERLRRGELVSTEAYRLQIVPFETAAPKRQATLFD